MILGKPFHVIAQNDKVSKFTICPSEYVTYFVFFMELLLVTNVCDGCAVSVPGLKCKSDLYQKEGKAREWCDDKCRTQKTWNSFVSI